MSKTKKSDKSKLLLPIIIILTCTTYYQLLNWFFFKTRFPYEGWDFIIPILSILFAYLNFKKLKNSKIKWKKQLSSTVIINIGLALGLYILGLMYPFEFIFQTFSFVFLLSGLLLYLGGYKVWSFFSFPIILLLFKLPWGLFLIKLFGTSPISLWHAQGVAICSTLLGIPSISKQLFIVGPRFQSEILPQCTGWYTIDAKMLVGTLFLYVSQGTFKLKSYKWLALFPAIMAVNFLRILILHLSWNLFTVYASAETIHTYINHLHKVMLFILFYLLAFGNDLKRKKHQIKK